MLREVEAGQRALRRHANVEYIEQLVKRHKIRVVHSLHDHVLVHVMEKTHPPLTNHDRQPLPEDHPVLITLIDPGNQFPSATLVTQLRLVLE